MSGASYRQLSISNSTPALTPNTGVVGNTVSDRSLDGRQMGIIPYENTAAPERENISQWWTEMISNFGLRMKYWRHGYSLQDHDALYGEHPTAQFSAEELLLVVAEKAGESVVFSKFGFQGAAEIRVALEIAEFQRVFGLSESPKPGDVFTFPDMYTGRPNALGQKLFEVTFANDDEINSTVLGGHYVWILDAVRFEPSFEPGAPKETPGRQVSDSDHVGILPGGTQTPSASKFYTQTADQIASDDFDQTTQGGGQDDVYGDY